MRMARASRPLSLEAGHHPFKNVSSLQQLMEQQTERMPERPEILNTDISPWLANSMMKSLEKSTPSILHLPRVCR